VSARDDGHLMKKTSIALLTQALVLGASADVLLVPAGEFVGRDGRPGKGLTWKLTDTKGQALAEKLTGRHQIVQFNFDYEHQAILSEKNGQPAPASGWAKNFAWRPGEGLFALNVQWTDKAKPMIDGHEYKYISPVISYDTATGEVSGVVNAALTNIPNLEMSGVSPQAMALNALSRFQVSQPPEQSTMNDVLKALLESLGLNVSAETTKEQATAAVAALKAKADKADELGTEVAMLKAKPGAGEPDPTKWVSLDSFTKLNEQVVLLSAKHTSGEVDKLISDAVAAGKCTPVVEEVWRNVGNKDVAMLKSLIDKTPANPALAGQQQSQANGGKQEQRSATAEGTPEELAMCKNLNLTLEQFRAGAEAV
jgi:phage I-like protein